MSSPTFSLLNVDHVQLNKAWNYKNVISSFYRLYLIDGGAGALSNPEQHMKLGKGFLYLIPSFTLVNHVCPAHLSQYYVHFIETSFDGSSLFQYCRKLLQIRSTTVDLHNFRRLLELNPGRDLRRSDNPKVYEKSKILNDFREKNAALPLSKVMTVKELADSVNLSVDHFSRCFYQHLGLRPLAYIHQKRIERAQFLMLTTDLSFTAISEETGFESVSYFSRIFKDITGQPPGVYKRTHSRFM